MMCACQVGAETIRSKADMRLWETVHDRNAPVTWPWADGSDSATLVFTNRATRSVLRLSVPRGEGEMRGGCAVPAEWSAGEALVDVALVQTRAGAEVARESATLAYVSCAGGGPITVLAGGTREWGRVRRVRVHAFDMSWTGLEGGSGYDIAWPNCQGMGILVH